MFAGLWLAVLTPPPAVAAAALSAADAGTYASAFEAIEADDWRGAKKLAARAGDQRLAKVIDWLDYQRRDADATFTEIAGFIEANPGWPRRTTLRHRAEAVADRVPDAATLLTWFGAHPPLTGRGALAYARAQAVVGSPDTTFVRDAWRRLDFNRDDEQAFARAFRGQLRAADHVARLDRLLWQEETSQARRMLRRVDRNSAALGAARLALMRQEPGVDAAIARVPTALRDDPALWYERLRWRRRKGQYAAAQEILLAPPADLVEPARWAVERRILARRAIADGLYSAAQQTAADHQLDSGAVFADAEFLAGWIRLVFLRDHADALANFTTLYDRVRFPISRARGAYWAGRAAAALKDPDTAQSWYAAAAAHSTTFYGQLALSELTGRLPALPPTPVLTSTERSAYMAQELVVAARQLHQVGASQRARPFLIHLLDLATTPADFVSLAQLAGEIGRHREAIQVAKRAAGRGIPMGDHGYPVRPVAGPTGIDAPEPALVLAIIRQESGFDATAVSRADARGMMQLLPSTARQVARAAGIPFNGARLLTDPDYNIGLGQVYLADLLAQFGGSYPLALAAYNAGPSRVTRWLRDIGDPRRNEIDMIDWIESIPFGETRNYVQRVVEAVPIYRHLLGTAQLAATATPPL